MGESLERVTWTAYEDFLSEGVVCFHSLSAGAFVCVSLNNPAAVSIFLKKVLRLLFLNYVYSCMFMCMGT